MIKLNELLGTEFPLIQGGMANIATGEFAAAVSHAGALGLIGAGGINADTLRENIRRCKALTDKPFGVNIMLMNPAAAEMAKVVVEEGVEEIGAQNRQFKARTGKYPGYLEGHAVASPNFFKGLEMVAARHNLPYFAMGCPGQAVTFRNTKVYAYMPKDFAAYEADPFTGVQDAVANAHKDGCDLMVFHPGYLDAYLLDHSTMTTARVREVDMLCRPQVRAWLEEQPVQLVTYDDLT